MVSFNNLLQELSELTETSYSHSYGVLQQRTHINISQRKRHIGQQLMSSNIKFTLSFSLGVRTICPPGVDMWQHHRVLPTREGHLSFGVQSFYRDFVTLAWLIDCPCGCLNPQVKWHRVTQSPSLSHVIGLPNVTSTHTKQGHSSGWNRFFSPRS